MVNEEQDILETLKSELSFLEKGGYGRSVRTPWQPTSVFQDSLTCINYGYPYRAHPCNECLLSNFVPEERQSEQIPCHHIPLDENGETVDSLELKENQQEMEEKVKEWLRARIKEIEKERATKAKI